MCGNWSRAAPKWRINMPAWCAGMATPASCACKSGREDGPTGPPAGNRDSRVAAVVCGGGFLLFFVPPERQKKVRQQLSRLIHVPFAFEFSGSQIIFFDLEEDFAKHDKVRANQQIEAFREWNHEPPKTPV